MWLIETSLVHHFRPFLKITKYSSSATPVVIDNVVSTEVFTDIVKGNSILSLLLVLLLSLLALFMLLFFLFHPTDYSESGCDMERQPPSRGWYKCLASLHITMSFCKLLCKSYKSTYKGTLKKIGFCSLCGAEVFWKVVSV